MFLITFSLVHLDINICYCVNLTCKVLEADARSVQYYPGTSSIALSKASNHILYNFNIRFET